jgi:hypothetical protein
MISDREKWACAQQQLHQHGSKAPENVAKRIAALEKAGDATGATTWLGIADGIHRLNDLTGWAQRDTRHRRSDRRFVGPVAQI